MTAPCIAASPVAVAAAVRIFERIPRAKEHDDILRRAGSEFSVRTYTDVLARIILLNQLYGTRLLAVGRMAEHICALKFNGASRSEWVEAIACLGDVEGGDIRRRMLSFASKYAHFFIDPGYFHISDDAAREVLARHWRSTATEARGWDYTAFNAKAEALRLESGLPDDRTLDRYLWVTGMYLRSQRPKTGHRINRNLAIALADRASAKDLKVLVAGLPARPARKPPPRRAAEERKQ